MENNNTRQKSNLWKKVVLLFCSVMVIWVICLVLTLCFANMYFSPSGDGEINNPTLLGDSSEVVNSLVSAFAFAGVIIAIIMQRDELRLQREDLELQREELKNTTKELSLQREEFETQNKTLQLQRFENTFFQMMSLQQEIVNNLSFSCTTFVKYEKDPPLTSNMKPEMGEREELKEIKGRECFYFLYEKAMFSFKDVLYRGGLKNIIHFIVKPSGDKHFSDLYCNLKEPKLLDHYFRHLFGIISFINAQNILDIIEKQTYINMVKNTLSPYELIWIFYNSISNNSESSNKELIEKYMLLSTLKKELLADGAHQYSYSPFAFFPENAITKDVANHWEKKQMEYGLD
ncbi:MAG: putative phage abortive infection protein [Prevotella sp.]|jgi:hypothetical protein|nr:putative phage abortive infection protein [Prevotella sp.]